jgi:uncharacterized protein with NAD-binding domain and iron-sulfur cluster
MNYQQNFYKDIHVLFNYFCNMIKCVIFGGGISGLTVAHELSNYNKLHRTQIFSIDIYERKDIIGGLARSSRSQPEQSNSSDNDCATELCWRVFLDSIIIYSA